MTGSPPAIPRRIIRRAQLVQPFGVGGIYDFNGESFVACDIKAWEIRGTPIGTPITLWRLAELLGVEGFRAAPPAPDRSPNEQDELPRPMESIPFDRFPKWLFCPSVGCGRMVRWSWSDEAAAEGAIPCCRECSEGAELAPVRFVYICPHGHLEDVPWTWWLHQCCGVSEAQQQCRHEEQLRYRSSGAGGGSLYSVEITCDACGATGTIGDLVGLKPPRWKCCGRQPWQRPDERIDCDGKDESGRPALQVVQRGASNVCYPVVESAIDIPPAALWINRSDDHPFCRARAFSKLLDRARTEPNWKSERSEDIEDIASDYRSTSDEVISTVDRLLADIQANVETIRNVDDLRYGEWAALLSPPEHPHERDHFIAEHADLSLIDPARFGSDESAIQTQLNAIRSIGLVRRIREVRALRGFRRKDSDNLVVEADLGIGLPWRPAVEVFGEGIFIAFRDEFITDWIERSGVMIDQRLEGLRERHANSLVAKWTPPPSPRFVAIHTLSHLLLRQLSFECGYGASSLREVIYASDEPDKTMAGILVHTSENDSEGSLGGLVRQGDPARLLPMIVVALRRAGWCSNDPICCELPAQGRDGLNRAACHACALVAETSCAYGNILLDRMLLVGNGGLMSPDS